VSVADAVTRAANAGAKHSRTISWRNQYAHALIAVDVFAVLAAVVVAQWLRFGELPDPVPQTASREMDYSVVSVAIAAAWLLLLVICRARSPRVIGDGAEEYRRVWLATISVFGGVAIVSMLLKLEIARGYLMIALPVGTVLLLAGRHAARQVVARRRQALGSCMTRVLVVGTAPAVRDLVQCLGRDASSGFEVVGACVQGSSVRTEIHIAGVGAVPVLGTETDVLDALAETRCNAVALTTTEILDGRGIRDLSWDLENRGIDLMVAPGVVDVAGPRLTMRPVASFPLIHVEKPQYTGAQKFEKRAFDVAFATIALVATLPLLLAVAVTIKLTSRGPVFYRSERIGLDGEPFQMIKFRTMVDDADRILSSLATSPGRAQVYRDPRITPVGRVLRKYGIDELPQFVNVLNRDMSVVGPRPSLAAEVVTYDQYVRRRLLVRPGITGLWQVSGRSKLSFDDSVRLDLFYVENWSMMADLLIVVKTIRRYSR
jgi:exopolysaccharide biosynthesis polyprenyl glycosylphosphotransferase